MKLPLALVRRLNKEARKQDAVQFLGARGWAAGVWHTLKVIAQYSLHQETRMARTTASTRKKHHAAPLSTVYRVKASNPGRRTRVSEHSQKRHAIRRSHELARESGYGAHAEVRTKDGALVYQAQFKIVGGRERFVVEEL